MVERMVSHHMECLATLQPLLSGIHFPFPDDRVEVAGNEDVHLGVECGEEPPDPGEHLDRDICKEGKWQLVNWAEVKAIVVTGELAKVDPQWVLPADVMVEPDTPAAVVEGGD